MSEKYVLKNKRRFTIFLLVFTVVLMSFLFVTQTYGYKPTVLETITVRTGDTLWSIADEYMESGDIRKKIYEIEKINNISDSTIYTGMEIKIPLEN